MKGAALFVAGVVINRDTSIEVMQFGPESMQRRAMNAWR